MDSVSVTPGDERVVSQKLIEAALEGNGCIVDEVLLNEVVDVNYMGTLNLRIKHTESLQHEEAPDELKINYVQFKTDVTPLFAAAHSGHVDIVRKLLTAGADVNQQLFRGYAITAATREGHYEVLSLLLKAGACQLACEEALLEACLSGQVMIAELLISSEMTRPEVSTSALIHASTRGLVDIVELLVKSGVDVNSWHRVLLRSIKPALYTSVDCTALIAAVVCRQAPVVKYLLDAGAKVDCQARLGAWSWDLSSIEVLRVGAGMAEPYNAAWCAIEYWDAQNRILPMLLKHISPNTEKQGRSLLCHAVLCNNAAAVKVLLDAGANIEYRISTEDGVQLAPLHLAARHGVFPVLKTLLDYGCDINARTDCGETALMLAAFSGHEECFRQLLISGADFGIANKFGQTVGDIIDGNNHRLVLNQIILDSISAGQKVYSSCLHSFSIVHVVASNGNAKIMRKVLEEKNLDLNLQNRFGLTAAMVAVKHGNMEVFKVLLLAGASILPKNSKGETISVLAEGSGYRDRFERIIFDAILGNHFKEREFKALHLAAKRGNSEVLSHLLKQGCSINSFDDDGYTPLMLSVREGHIDSCKLLLSLGADCYILNPKGETALLLARRCTSRKIVEGVLLDHMAKKLVLTGEELAKHTRQGKGRPHIKVVKMLKSGVLKWGESKRRNVFCKEASLGPSIKFQKNRKSLDIGSPEIFRVVTISGKEIHFDASSTFTAELWVRGINLMIKESMGSNTC